MEISLDISPALLEYMKIMLVRERERVLKHIKPNLETGCWEWTATIKPSGYGQGYDRYSDGKCVIKSAHRIVYKLYKGDIPEGFDLDHLCSNRKCVNPDHLEPLSKQDHRKRTWANIKKNPVMTCKHGHPLSGDNLYSYPLKNKPGIVMRCCKACHLVRSTKFWRTKDKRNPEVRKAFESAKSKAVAR